MFPFFISVSEEAVWLPDHCGQEEETEGGESEEEERQHTAQPQCQETSEANKPQRDRH